MTLFFVVRFLVRKIPHLTMIVDCQNGIELRTRPTTMAGMAPPGGGAGGAFKVGAKFMDGKYTHYFTINQVGLELRILK